MKLRYSIVVGAALVGASLGFANENFTEGSTWTGIMRTARISQKTKKTTGTSSTDVKLVVKTRKDNKFTGEFYRDSDRDGMVVEGTLTDKGILKFTMTRQIKGSWGANVIGNYQFTGLVKGSRIDGKAALVAGTTSTSITLSEFVMNLKE